MVMGNMQFQFTLVTGFNKGDSGPAGAQNAENPALLRAINSNPNTNRLLRLSI